MRAGRKSLRRAVHHRLTYPVFTALLVLCLVTIALAMGRRAQQVGTQPALSSVAAVTLQAAPAPPRGHNISVRPEVFSFSHRVGRRFGAPGREVSMLSGTLVVGSERQRVRVIRLQQEGGERVEIALGGGPPSLTWSAGQGALSAGGAANDDERAIMERLIYDSADQFVLAQLRGASYYVVARDARPPGDDGAESYAGPLYTVVRVGEPETGGQGAQGRTRLYYVNAQTGLIDKILSTEHGEQVVAELSGWTNQQGELLPTRTTWRRQGQVLMELSIDGASHGPRQ